MSNNLMSQMNRTLREYAHGTTRSRREKRNIMRQIIKELLDSRIAPNNFESLTSKAIHQLVSNWKKSGNSDATIINKLSILRSFNLKGGFGIDIPSNKAFDLSKVKKKSIKTIRQDIINQVSSPITECILGLQLEFGLTKLEAIRLPIGIAIESHDLIISKNIAYNHKERFIAIYRPEQKALIKKLENILADKFCIADLANERHISNLYNAELTIIGIDYRTNFRSTYANNRLAELQRKRFTRKDAYQVLMDEMGYCSHHTLQEAIR
jgi:hypothetical protein